MVGEEGNHNYTESRYEISVKKVDLCLPVMNAAGTYGGTSPEISVAARRASDITNRCVIAPLFQ